MLVHGAVPFGERLLLRKARLCGFDYPNGYANITVMIANILVMFVNRQR